MTDKVVVLVTCSGLREAQKLARALVDIRLVACVNITSPVESVYRWEGKVEKAREFLLLMKTTRELFGEVQSTIRKIHSYTTPEILCLPVVDGSTDYLRWVTDSVKEPSRSEE